MNGGIQIGSVPSVWTFDKDRIDFFYLIRIDHESLKCISEVIKAMSKINNDTKLKNLSNLRLSQT